MLRITQVVKYLALFSSMLWAVPAQALGTELKQEGFAYGGECSQLTKLSRQEILAITNTIHSDNFYRFCIAKGIYSCSDYTAMLRGAGSLEENDSFGCSFLPDAS